MLGAPEAPEPIFLLAPPIILKAGLAKAPPGFLPTEKKLGLLETLFVPEPPTVGLF